MPLTMAKNPFTFFSFTNRKKHQTIPFKEYYTEWFNTLKNPLLPLLTQSISSPSSPALLSSHLNLLLHHFLSYYDALDLAVTTDPNNLPYLLHPSWRTPLEKPFLFLGDLHPYVFPNLVRSFLEQENGYDEEDEIGNVVLDQPWPVMMAWRDPSARLIGKIEQVECGLRLMVPALIDRMKKAQGGFVARVAGDWVNSGGRKENVVAVVGEAVAAEMEELVGVFLDGNRLRRNIISEIVGALSLYQGALFLQALAQFLVGFRDSDFN